MALILQRVIDRQSTQALTLAGETWTRMLPFGSSWSRLRIGFLATLDAGPVAGASNGLTIPVTIDDIKIMCGVCSSRSQRDGLYNCENAVGVNWVGSAGITTNSAVSVAGSFPVWYYGATATPNAFVQQWEVLEGRRMARPSFAPQVGVSLASFGVDAPGSLISRRIRLPFVLDISRNLGGGGAFVMNVYYFTGAPTVDVTPAQLMDSVETSGTPSVNGANLANASWSTNVFAGEAGGPLDTVFICGGRMAYPLYVYAIGVAMVSDAGNYQTVGGGGWDWFQQYPNTGTLGAVSGTYAPGATTLNSGMGWAQNTAWTINGTAAAYPVNGGLAGTSLGYPFDTFETYGTSTAFSAGSLSNTIVNGGFGWGSPAIFNGTGQPGPKIGLAGTSAFWPYDSFDTYVAGTITSVGYGGTPLTSGTGWTSPIFIY